MEWNREKRYRKLEEITGREYEELLKITNSCNFRQKFHIQPKTGLLNDPNGFSFFQGRYHLFYQWFPLGPVHGLKYWYHMTSLDLINWEDRGIALAPDTPYDSHGVFSGSGFATENKLYLFYTGNTRDINWKRTPYQCLAIMDKNENIKKFETPLIKDSPKGFTDNFRDPKVFKKNNKYYCLIGAENEKNQGKIVYYESENLIDWSFKGTIKTKYNSGFMWECPDYFEFEEKGILMFCSQGQKKQGNEFNNPFPAGYIITNKIDFENPKVENKQYKEFDHGFDFYAPQTTTDKDERRILIGWLGVPEVECVTEDKNWAHCLTLPRELHLRDNKLIQLPIKELDHLKFNFRNFTGTFKHELEINEFKGEYYYLKCKFSNLSSGQVGVKLRTGIDEETYFYYDIDNSELILDRGKSGKLFALEYGTIRKCSIEKITELKLEIFVDKSSLEIFINDGEEVFTARIFPKIESQGIKFISTKQIKLEAEIADIRL